MDTHRLRCSVPGLRFFHHVTHPIGRGKPRSFFTATILSSLQQLAVVPVREPSTTPRVLSLVFTTRGSGLHASVGTDICVHGV